MTRTKIFLLIIALCGLSIPAFALNGEVVATSGKVEFQDKNGVWKALKQGDTILAGTMISTGFKSEATVKLGESVLTIRPLTRMTLTQLVEKDNAVDTELYLEVGNVKAEVNSLNAKKNSFKVRSPVATASVRGTVFEMGEALVILRGSVEFSTPVGQRRTGTAGQQLNIVGNLVAPPSAAVQERMGTIALNSTPSTEIKSPIIATSTVSASAPAAPSAAGSADTSLVLSLE